MSLSPCCNVANLFQKGDGNAGTRFNCRNSWNIQRPLISRKTTKFTPERIQQIKSLVERGKSREDIAELVGVTVGSLAVTCSKLGISLRRRMVNNGVSVLHPIKGASVARTSLLEGGREAPSRPDEVATSFKHDAAATAAKTPSQARASGKDGFAVYGKNGIQRSGMYN